MKNRRPFTGRAVALASVLLAAMLLAACEPSKPAAPAPTAASQTATAEKVFVVFEGPWAFVGDPKDANTVLALAPKTKGHRDLNVAASNNSNLAAGVYYLSVPAHGAPAAATLDASFAQAKIDAKSLQRALDDKSGRYVIRVPKPEAYVAAKRTRSRVGVTYPPDASTEQNHVTSVSLRYTVSSLNGFSLSGTPDSGTFNPLLLQVDTPAIHFMIEPAQDDDPADKCDTHSRESFRDLVKFLTLTLYVDFPDNPADCHAKDPQKMRPAKAQGPTSPFEQVTTLLGGSQTVVETASVGGVISPDYQRLLTGSGGERLVRYPIAGMVFFHLPSKNCGAPILMLTTNP